MLIDKTLAQYTNQLASDEPTPGGGSSLALVGLNATCLVMMAANVTITKLAKKGATCTPLVDAVAMLEPIKQEFATLVDKDAQAFQQILGAMKMPKSNEDEIVARKQALQQTYVYSAKVSLDIISNATKCFEIADQVIEYADQFVVSDAHIGKALAKTVATLNVHNVDVNVDCITDQQAKADLSKQKADLLAKIN